MDRCPLIKKHLFLVIPIKFFNNGTEETLGRVHHYQTDYMLFTVISFVIVWFFSINIYTNYLSIVYVLFYSYSLPYGQKQTIKIYLSLYQALLFYILLL